MKTSAKKSAYLEYCQKLNKYKKKESVKSISSKQAKRVQIIKTKAHKSCNSCNSISLGDFGYTSLLGLLTECLVQTAVLKYKHPVSNWYGFRVHHHIHFNIASAHKVTRSQGKIIKHLHIKTNTSSNVASTSSNTISLLQIRSVNSLGIEGDYFSQM